MVKSAADVGNTFSVNCSEGGIIDANRFTVKYQWYKDKHPLPGESHSALHFRALALSDFGGYTCVKFL